MKTCRNCRVMKPLDEFYRHPFTADGYLNECKACRIEYQRGRIRAGLTPEIDRRRYRNNPRRQEQVDRQRKNWFAKNPEKRAAHYAVNNAVRDGRLKRRPCEVCGEKAHAHHDDYSKPLEVRWLCPTHHARWHAAGFDERAFRDLDQGKQGDRLSA